jgi:phage terminase small subunit
MGVIKNHKHELFAQALFGGHTADQSYEIAGYSPNSGNCIRLKGNESVKARVAELQQNAARRAEISEAKVLSELAKIGFADIRKAVEWRGNMTREYDNPEGGDIAIIREITNQQVRLLDSDRLDDETAAAISEVRQSPTGGLSIKFHDKQAALVNIGKHLGMFKDRVDISGEVAHHVTMEYIKPK